MVDHSPGHLSWLSKSWRIGTIFRRPGQTACQLHSLSQPCPPTKEAAFTKQAQELKLGSADFCSQIPKVSVKPQSQRFQLRDTQVDWTVLPSSFLLVLRKQFPKNGFWHRRFFYYYFSLLSPCKYPHLGN